jgi:NAD-dependent SIR2 family protein deacetylase
MIKRFKFQCWNCPKTYYRSLEITNQQEIIVSCPYCNADAVVNLRPYGKELKTLTVMRGEKKDKRNEEDLQLPDILPTRKPD